MGTSLLICACRISCLISPMIIISAFISEPLVISSLKMFFTDRGLAPYFPDASPQGCWACPQWFPCQHLRWPPFRHGHHPKVIWVGYVWPTLFCDFILAIKHCANFWIFFVKTRTPHTPLHHIIIVGIFCKWGINFMECRTPLAMATSTSSLSLTTLLNRWKSCLHSTTQLRWQPTYCLTMLLHSLPYLSNLCLIMVPSYKMSSFKNYHVF